MENNLSTQKLILTLIGLQKGHKLASMFSATNLVQGIFLLILLHRGHQDKTRAIGFAQKNIIEQKL